MAKDNGKVKTNGKATKAKPATSKRGSGLPLPAGVIDVAHQPSKALRKAEARHLRPLTVAADGSDATVLDRLWETVEARRVSGDVTASHSARLLARGTPKVAQKLGEEAVECVIEATLGNVDPGEADMRTLVIVGASTTRRVGRWIYTPRSEGERPSASQRKASSGLLTT